MRVTRLWVPLLGLLTAVGLLHVAHIVGGHRWFSVFGPLIALAFTAVIMAWLRGRNVVAGLGIWAALVVVLVVPEWIEGEIAAGHTVTWATIETHGASTVLVLALAIGAGVLWEASRLLALIKPR